MNSIYFKSDSLGAVFSSLCLVHCIATPFLFVAQACTSSCCEDSPVWWQSLDYLFLTLSFFAVYYSGRKSSSKLVKKGLWVSWVALFITVMNEKFLIIPLPEMYKHVSALSLVSLHLYNLKYCQCSSEGCVSTR
ncbi:MerC domain-containing protein [bacterium SCSIO 12643]|nr:MerC domain-containing protein [bacterium SCSIO 12643]